MSLKNDGYVGVWLLIIFVAIGVGVYALLTPEPSMVSYLIYGTAGIFLSVVLWFQARRDVHAFAQVSFAITFGVGVISGAVVFMGKEAGTGALVLFAISIIGFIVSVAIMARSEWGPDDLPNFLNDNADWSNVSEIEGIQFLAVQSALILRSSEEVVFIEIIAQNTWSTEREICFALKPAQRASLNRAGLIYDKEPRISLGPAAVGKLTIGITAHPDAKGRYSLDLHPKITSRSVGKRIRRKRATIYSPPTSGLTTLLGLVVGLIVWGGGIKFPIRVKIAKRTTMVPCSPFETTTQILWVLDEKEKEALQI